MRIQTKFNEVLRLLEDYKKEYGNCEIRQDYKTTNGIPLGMIVHSIRCGKRKTTPEEKAKLDAIGFIWKVRASSISFEEVFKLLEAYKEEYDNCEVRQDYKTTNGIPLGIIVNSIRCGNRKTTPEEKAKLDAIGFVWKVKPYSFEEVFRLLEEYKEEYGNCEVPRRHKTVSGFPLGAIVSSIRSGNRKTTPEEKAKLDAIGFVWKKRASSISFEEVFKLLEAYKEEYGNCEVRCSHKTASGVPLGMIVRGIRSGRRKTTIEEKEKLDAIGFVWRVKTRKK